MSQRNPMNERYTTDAKAGGSSRKSAASAKPKSSAASSVVMGSKKKKAPQTKNDKRAAKREQRNKEYEAERKYGDPPTKKFKIAKKLWIGSLIGSVLTVALSFATSKFEDAPEWLPMACLIAAYVFIIVTLYLDLGVIRKQRKQYAAHMAAIQTKENRAEEKKRKREARLAAKEEEKRREEEEIKRKEAKASRSEMSFSGKIKEFFKLNK